MRKLTILQLTLGLSIGDWCGGAERLVVNLVRALDRTRFDPIVCAFWRHNTTTERYWANELSKAGIETFFAQDWPGKHTVAAHRRAMATIGKHFADRSIDITHSHFQMGSLAALATKRHVQPSALVRTAHAGKEWGNGALAYVCRQMFTKWVFPLTFDAQTAVSVDGWARVNGYPGTRLSGRRAVLITNGISLARSGETGDARSVRVELGLPVDSVVIGNVARLSPEKGHYHLLQAAALVVKAVPNARFVIVGDGPLRANLRDHARRLELDRSLVWAGSQTDVERYYRAMDLFVLPSVYEGLPIAALESMAARVPVIASNLAGLRHIIRHDVTGWLVGPGDSQALADAIILALGNREAMRRVADAAATEVVPLYSLEHITRKYEQIYASLLSAKLDDGALP